MLRQPGDPALRRLRVEAPVGHPAAGWALHVDGCLVVRLSAGRGQMRPGELHNGLGHELPRPPICPAHQEIITRVVELEDPVAPNVRGWVKNTGGAAKYVELAVKLTPPNDPDTIYMSGWTNFTNFGSGETRAFTIYLFGATPPADYADHWRYSTDVGGAAY